MISSTLGEMRAADKGMKCIVFSFFTTFLDLVQVHLKREWRYVRLDGSMSVEQRQQVRTSMRTTVRTCAG